MGIKTHSLYEVNPSSNHQLQILSSKHHHMLLLNIKPGVALEHCCLWHKTNLPFYFPQMKENISQGAGSLLRTDIHKVFPKGNLANLKEINGKFKPM